MYKFGIHLKVKNIVKSLSFYQALGLKPCFAYGDKKFLKQFNNKIPTAQELYRGVSFDINGATLEIADGHLAVKSEVFKETINSSKVSAMINVPSLEKIEAICQSHSFNISVLPKIYPWGTREMVVKDPDRFVLVFIEKIKQVVD